MLILNLSTILIMEKQFFSIMCIMGLNITDQLEQERSEPLQKYNPLSITKRTTDFEGEISTL